MESVTKSKTPLVLSNSDCAKILQYFENSTAEKVLLLRTKGEKCEPDKIDGVFNLCGNFVELANEEHILFSVAQIMKCMDVCMQTQSGFIMIHNHKRGNVFSKSDMQTEVQLLHEIIKRQLPSFHFMVLGMDSIPFCFNAISSSRPKCVISTRLLDSLLLVWYMNVFLMFEKTCKIKGASLNFRQKEAAALYQSRRTI